MDPELALASVVALVRLVYEPNRAKELLDVLEDCAIALDESPDPDIALALAQGWTALRTTPFFLEIESGKRARAVADALRAAELIDPADGRDAFGCDLARILHSIRLEAGVVVRPRRSSMRSRPSRERRALVPWSSPR